MIPRTMMMFVISIPIISFNWRQMEKCGRRGANLPNKEETQCGGCSSIFYESGINIASSCWYIVVSCATQTGTRHPHEGATRQMIGVADRQPRQTVSDSMSPASHSLDELLKVSGWWRKDCVGKCQTELGGYELRMDMGVWDNFPFI